MRGLLMIAAATAALCLGGCTTTRLSGSIIPRQNAPASLGLAIGILADSQFQTRQAFRQVRFFKNPRMDRWIDVTMRPPALDWAARSMVRAQLERLRTNHVEAVFFLGDGANNGCRDEFADGYGLPPGNKTVEANSQGVLAVLEEFRKRSNIPVFFVLGNHDFLGAGTTSERKYRKPLCEDPRGEPDYRREAKAWPGQASGDSGANPPLTKYEVMALIDRFNRESAALEPRNWRYRSNFENGSAATVRAACEEPSGKSPESQHLRPGCFIAATLDLTRNGTSVQFLLIDTNDCGNNVAIQLIPGLPMKHWAAEGVFGCVSYIGKQSQVGWFKNNTAAPVAMRVGLTHYNVAHLRSSSLLRWAMRGREGLIDLFADKDKQPEARQISAFLISGHTHTQVYKVHDAHFYSPCLGAPGCSFKQKILLAELNVGSTTDYTNLVTVLRLNPGDRREDSTMIYERQGPDAAACSAAFNALADFQFSKPGADAAKQDGSEIPDWATDQTKGWRALGINGMIGAWSAWRPRWA